MNRIQLQGLKYSLDETTPVDTIQVKQNTKTIVDYWSESIVWFWFYKPCNYWIIPEAFFSQEQFDYEILSRVNQKELKARESDMVEDDQ